MKRSVVFDLLLSTEKKKLDDDDDEVVVVSVVAVVGEMEEREDEWEEKDVVNKKTKKKRSMWNKAGKWNSFFGPRAEGRTFSGSESPAAAASRHPLTPSNLLFSDTFFQHHFQHRGSRSHQSIGNNLVWMKNATELLERW